MHKRNHGYIIVALLVLTGFGSQVYNATITSAERRFLNTELKTSKKELLSTVKDLSEQQLNFKPTPESWSVKECIYHIAISEKNLWAFASSGLEAPADASKRSEIKHTDQQLIEMMKDRSVKAKNHESYDPSKSKWTSAGSALEAFEEDRNKLIKYVKTTTQDLRNHVIKNNIGYIDSYQMLLLITAHNSRHNAQIKEIMAHKNFPK